MLRPHGDGTYPAISKEVDRSMIEDTPDAPDVPENDDLEADSSELLQSDHVVVDNDGRTYVSPAASTLTRPDSTTSLAHFTEANSASLDGPVAIELEDLLPEPEEELSEPRAHIRSVPVPFIT
ncbi:hypothetical protein B0H10DRAFT_1886807 [Mycena sp. CBHHK59/15]|nr:hypothetical protein B0H10DRAFT_1886807 [Mycena sp. CBHHK59/15]